MDALGMRNVWKRNNRTMLDSTTPAMTVNATIRAVRMCPSPT